MKVEYLITWCPGFPGDTIAVKELICGLVKMQESHQFWHAGFRDGVVSCNLWANKCVKCRAIGSIGIIQSATISHALQNAFYNSVDEFNDRNSMLLS